jgi:N-acetylglucosaminyldiphosphoundecaprenol N-acetyl-beta-D-mannosaminyltransferase
LAIVGIHDGYSDIFSPSTVAAINEFQPDIVWAGLGDPLQGHWANVMRPQLNAKLIITCGGMFKIVTGDIQRVSYSWQQRGFEWLYRVWQEPQTWRRYLLGLPLFGFRVLRQRLFSFPSRIVTTPNPNL